MRIRSIKYRTNNTNSTEFFKSQIQFTSTHQVDHNYKAKYPHMNRQLFTQQYFNIKQEQTQSQINGHENMYRNDFQMLKNDLKNIKSQKVNFKGVSLHESRYNNNGNKYENKQNRTSIFQIKPKSMSKQLTPNANIIKPFDCHNQKFQRLKLRLSSFVQQKNMPKLNINQKSRFKQNQTIRQNDQNIESNKNEIILGQNLTYQLQTLENDIGIIEEDIKKQKTKYDKIKKQMHSFQNKIQKNIEHIIKDFKKHLQNLNNQLNKGKTQKCTILLNWKNVIKAKSEQYSHQRAIMDQLNQQIDRCQIDIRGAQTSEQKKITFDDSGIQLELETK